MEDAFVIDGGIGSPRPDLSVVDDDYIERAASPHSRAMRGRAAAPMRDGTPTIPIPSWKEHLSMFDRIKTRLSLGGGLHPHRAPGRHRHPRHPRRHRGACLSQLQGQRAERGVEVEHPLGHPGCGADERLERQLHRHDRRDAQDRQRSCRLRASAPTSRPSRSTRRGYCVEDNEGRTATYHYVGGNPGAVSVTGALASIIQRGTCLTAVGYAAT